MGCIKEFETKYGWKVSKEGPVPFLPDVYQGIGLHMPGIVYVKDVPATCHYNYIYGLLRPFGIINRIIKISFPDDSCHYIVIFQAEEAARIAFNAMSTSPEGAFDFVFFFISVTIIHAFASFMIGSNIIVCSTIDY